MGLRNGFREVGCNHRFDLMSCRKAFEYSYVVHFFLNIVQAIVDRSVSSIPSFLS